MVTTQSGTGKDEFRSGFDVSCLHCSKKVQGKGEYQRQPTDVAHVRVNLFFQKALKHAMLQRLQNCLSAPEVAQASCAAFC